MSYTTIKALYLGDRVEDLRELRNSHGSAPVVWDAIAQRYLRATPFSWIRRTEEIWKVVNYPGVPDAHRAVLAMTFDWAYIGRAHYKQASADIRAFLVDLGPFLHPGGVNHWPAIADLLDEAPDCDGIGFQMTSVSDNMWVGDWGEEAEDYAPFEWNRAWEVYDGLAERRGVKG